MTETRNEERSTGERPRSAGLVARSSITTKAPRTRVWDALVNPDTIRKYMFGTNVVSDFEKGSPITWEGEWEGKPYKDKGEILEIDPQRRLRYSHFSPLSGAPDRPENYHTVTIDLADKGPETLVTLSQDNNANEKERDHSEKNWRMMLQSLKKVLED